MKKIYVLLLLVFIIKGAWCQCPVIDQALIHAYNDGSGEEGTNEFIVFTTAVSATAGSYTIYYGSNNPPSTSSTAKLSGLDASAKTGPGGFSAGCTIHQVTSSATVIPANSTVVFYTYGLK